MRNTKTQTSDKGVSAQIESLLALCNDVQKNDVARWQAIILELNTHFCVTQNEILKAKILFEYARFYYIVKSNYKKSIEFCHEAKKYFSQNDIELVITFNFLLGINYHLKGDYKGAQPYYNHCMALLKTKKDITLSDYALLAKTYYNIGLLHSGISDKKSSIRHIEKALKIYLKIKDKSGIARCYNALGHHHPKAMKDVNIAIDFYLKGMQYFKEDNDLIGLATAYNNIGYQYGVLKQTDKAIKYLQLGLALRQKLGNKKNIAASYHFMGIISETNEMYKEAIEYYLKAENIFKEIDSKHELPSLYIQLAELFLKIEDYQGAYHYRLHYSQLKEEILAFDYSTSLNLEVSKLLSKSQEEETLFKRQKQKELSEYATQLEDLQAELTQLIFVVSHDFREPIRMMANYSKLIANKYILLAPYSEEICKISLQMWEILQRLQQSVQMIVKHKQ